MRKLLVSILFMVTVVSSNVQASVPTDVEEILDQREFIQDMGYSDDDIFLIGLVTVGEAEGESELGKRLVIDTILNRIDTDIYPDTAYEVCYQKSQYSCMHNGRCNRCKKKVTQEILDLVKEEILERTNDEVLYFNTGGYNCKHPIIQEGAHYFGR